MPIPDSSRPAAMQLAMKLKRALGIEAVLGRDEALGRRLWDVSAELTGLTP